MLNFGGNCGYVGYSMSKRAAAAYENNERPRTKWTKKELLKSIESICEAERYEVPEVLYTFKKEELASRFLSYAGWHHTSKYGNETDFFGIDEEKVAEFCDPASFYAKKAEEKEEEEADRHAQRVYSALAHVSGVDVRDAVDFFVRQVGWVDAYGHEIKDEQLFVDFDSQSNVRVYRVFDYFSPLRPK